MIFYGDDDHDDILADRRCYLFWPCGDLNDDIVVILPWPYWYDVIIIPVTDDDCPNDSIIYIPFPLMTQMMMMIDDDGNDVMTSIDDDQLIDDN